MKNSKLKNLEFSYSIKYDKYYNFNNFLWMFFYI